MNRKERRKLRQRYLWARPEPLSFQGKAMKLYFERELAADASSEKWDAIWHVYLKVVGFVVVGSAWIWWVFWGMDWILNGS